MNTDPAPSETGVPARHSLGRPTAADADHGQEQDRGGGPGARFPVVPRGYDRSPVDARLTEMDQQVRDSALRADRAEAGLAAARAQVQRLQEDLAAVGNAEDDRFGQRVERVLQAAEREAADLRDKAESDVAAVIGNARAEAELQRQRTEKALLGRAAKLDREFTSRSAALDAREREIDQRVEEARRAAEAIRSDAERVAATARAEAERQTAELRREIREQVERERAGAVAELDRLAGMREDVRGELVRVYGMLRGALDREPDAPAFDGGMLFGDLGEIRGPGGLRDREDGSRAQDRDDDGARAREEDAPDSGGDQPSGRLRLAPEPRDAADDLSGPDASDVDGPGVDGADVDGADVDGADVDGAVDGADARTVVGTIPPYTVASLGVLPFGDRTGAGPANGRAFAFELALPRPDGPDGDGDATGNHRTSDDVTDRTAAPGATQTRSTLPTRGRR